MRRQVPGWRGDHAADRPWQIDLERRACAIKSLLDRTLVLQPDNAEALSRTAQYYLFENQDNLALVYLNKALRYGKNDPLVLSMAAGEALANLEFSRAIELQLRAVALDPLAVTNHVKLAYYLYFAGKYDEAAKEADNDTELNADIEDETRLVLAHIAT